jgi:hypothetical protein
MAEEGEAARYVVATSKCLCRDLCRISYFDKVDDEGYDKEPNFGWVLFISRV